MTEYYRFFNWDENDDREYIASDFAEYFARFLSDGLYTENGQAGLQVSPGEGLQVIIDTGYAYMRGYMYKNDGEPTLTKDLQAADANLDRIDRIVLRFDEVAKTILVDVKTGVPGSNPAAPALEETEIVKEMSLAKVRVNHGAVSLTAANITDERLTEFCGLVSSLIDIPAGEMWEAWLAMMNDIEAAWATQTQGIDEDWAAQTANIASAWDTQRTAWEDWFATLENVAGNRIMVGETEPAELEAGDFWFRVIA